MATRSSFIVVERDMIVPVAVALAISLGMVVLGIVGELLGWWNETGQLLAVVGIAATALTFLITLLIGATRKDVRALGTGVRADVKAVGGDVRQVGEDVRQLGDGVRHVGSQVEKVDEDIVGLRADVRAGNAQVVGLLTQIRDRLGPGSPR